jgi:hypothetical protein
MRTMSRKLIGYALGRTVLPSDEPLIDKLMAAGSSATMAKLLTEIVDSKQFRYRRNKEEEPAAVPAQQKAATPAAGKTPQGGGM